MGNALEGLGRDALFWLVAYNEVRRLMRWVVVLSMD